MDKLIIDLDASLRASFFDAARPDAPASGAVAESRLVGDGAIALPVKNARYTKTKDRIEVEGVFEGFTGLWGPERAARVDYAALKPR